MRSLGCRYYVHVDIRALSPIGSIINMNPKSISMIHKQLMAYFKVKYGSILIG